MDIKKQTVKRWHPWQDKPGQRHTPTIWKNNQLWYEPGVSFLPKNELDMIECVGREQLYVFCNDIASKKEFCWSDELLLNKDTEAYIQKSGKIVALRVKSGRTCGFLIPSRSWGYPQPHMDLLSTINEIYRLFGYEAITPASLSEKLLRSTLPEKLNIFRPSVMLRKTLLENSDGPRIDILDMEGMYPSAFKYDINKAYLKFSRRVPNPFRPPNYHPHPQLETVLEGVGFWHVEMIAHGQGIHPIYISSRDEKGRKKKSFPQECEQLSTWLWTKEVAACLRKGYTVVSIKCGYKWSGECDFLCKWTDLLWDRYQQVYGDDSLKAIIKSMMVSFPGRCLREPKNHLLIPRGQQQKGDIPISTNWYHFEENWQTKETQEEFFTNWYVRSECNPEDTALTPIGAYIVMSCRMEIYEQALREEERGNTFLGSYVDCLYFASEADLPVGQEVGQYKRESYTNVWMNRNRFVGTDQQGIATVRAPGLTGEKRIELLKKYRSKTLDSKTASMIE